MPSWSPSDSRPDKVAAPPATPAATAIDHVRRLLEQAVARAPRDKAAEEPRRSRA